MHIGSSESLSYPVTAETGLREQVRAGRVGWGCLGGGPSKVGTLGRPPPRVRRGARVWWAAMRVWTVVALWGALSRPVGYLIIRYFE